MLGISLVLFAVGIGLWVGWTSSASWRTFFSYVAGAVLSFIGALALYGSLCDAASIPDILLFRTVPDQYFCSGNFSLFTHAFAIAAVVLLFRLFTGKESSSDGPQRDI
jgi:hypothetical protein